MGASVMWRVELRWQHGGSMQECKGPGWPGRVAGLVLSEYEYSPHGCL
jgi:hypothetical protein